MTPEQRDILLVPVLFNDLSSVKRRPVLVLSAKIYNRIYNLSKSIIVKRYGKLKAETFQQVLKALDEILGR